VRDDKSFDRILDGNLDDVHHQRSIGHQRSDDHDAHESSEGYRVCGYLWRFSEHSYCNANMGA